MASTLRKWKAIFTVYIQEGLTYRASGVIWILTDLATAVTMPLVWASAAKSGPIAGYTTGDFVLYYLCLLFIQNVVTSHMMWEIATEIKEGQFAPMLLRPVSFFQFTFFRNLAWRLLRLVYSAPFFALLLFAYRGYLGDAHVSMGWEFWVSVALGHLVSLSFVMMIAMIALYVQEAYSIFELYYIPMLFLSGQLFPIAVMPGWVQTLRYFFPFYFTTAAPTEIMVGRLTGPAVYQTLAIQCAWIVFSLVAGRALFRHGLRSYNLVGM